MKMNSMTKSTVFIFLGTLSIYLAGLFNKMSKFNLLIGFILTFLLIFIGLNLFYAAYKILAKIHSYFVLAYTSAKINEKEGKLSDGDKYVLEKLNGTIIEETYNELKREGTLNLP